MRLGIRQIYVLYTHTADIYHVRATGSGTDACGKEKRRKQKEGREGKEEEEQQHLFPKCLDDLALSSESQQMSANFSTITDAGLTLMIGCPQEPGRGVCVHVPGVFLSSISIITMNQEMHARCATHIQPISHIKPMLDI